MRAPVGALASAVLPLGFKGRNYLIGLAGSDGDSVAHCNVYFDAASRRRLSPALAQLNASKLLVPEASKASLIPRDLPVEARAMAVDFRTYLVDDILVKVDRASMLASLEVRSPWLDPRIVEFAFSSVPTDHKVTSRERKILTRRLAQRLLPTELDLERKQGFSMPLSAWFRGQWGEHIEAVLLDDDGAGLFDRAELQRLLRSQQRGYENTQRLFALAIFELWRRHYGVAAPR